MNKTHLIFYILVLVTIWSCKTSLCNIDVKYKKAIGYLHNSSVYGENFHLVDTLFYISRTTLFKQKGNVREGLKQLDSLELLDKKYMFPATYYDFCFKDNYLNASKNIYFSKPIENTLLIEVINNKGNINHSYDHLTSYNTTDILYFEFSDDNEIINVKKSSVIYD